MNVSRLSNLSSGSNTNLNFTNRKAVRQRVTDKAKQTVMKKMFLSGLKRLDPKRIGGTFRAGYRLPPRQVMPVYMALLGKYGLGSADTFDEKKILVQ